MFLFTKRRLVLAVLALVLCSVVGYFLFTPDLLAFQTRVIAVREAYRNDQSIIETLKFTEQMEDIRAKCGMGNRLTGEKICNFPNEVRGVLNSKQDTKELINYLRIYAQAMYASFASNRPDDTGAYAAVFFEVLKKIRDQINKGIVDRRELTEIKDELKLQGMDAAEFDAILDGTPFP